MKQFLVILMLSLAQLVNAQTEKVWSDDEVGEIKHYVTYTKEYKHLVSEGVITEVPEFSAFRRLISKGQDAKLTGDFTLSTLTGAKMDQHEYLDTTLIVHVVDIGEHWGYFGEDDLIIPIYEKGTNKIVSSFEGDYLSMVYLNEDGEEKTSSDYLDEALQKGYNLRVEEERSENEEKSSDNHYYYGCNSYMPVYRMPNYCNPYWNGGFYSGYGYNWGVTVSVGSFYGGYPYYGGAYGSGIFSSWGHSSYPLYGRTNPTPAWPGQGGYYGYGGGNSWAYQGSYGNLYYGQLQDYPRGVSVNGQGYAPRSGSGNTSGGVTPRSSSGSASAGQPRSVSKGEKFRSISIDQSDMDRWNRERAGTQRSSSQSASANRANHAEGRPSQNRNGNVQSGTQRKPSSGNVGRTSTSSRNAGHQARPASRPSGNAQSAKERTSRTQQAKRPVAQQRPQQQARPATATQRPPQSRGARNAPAMSRQQPASGGQQRRR